MKELKLNKKVIIIGGEGNGGVIASCIEDNRSRFGDFEWDVAGFLNDFEIGGKVHHYPVLGGTDDIGKFLKEDYYFMYAIHMIGRNVKNEEIFKKMNIPRDRFATIVHKTAFIAHNAVLDPGVFVMSNCYVATLAHVGMCSLIMANSIFGHNTSCGPLCHFSAGSITGGYLTVGKVASVALGGIVLEKCNIGNFAVVGANSLVTKNIPDYEIHVGSPAKFMRKIRMD
jgi:sugar O-acyltransferase (sialic acid O-acetyltransferase NeuD family)